MKETIALERRKTCLLLVDFQEEQRSDPLYGVEGFATVLANAARLLQEARRSGMRVIHAAYERDFAAVPPRAFEPVSPEGRPLFSDKDHPLTTLCREVAPVAGETVISKNDASVFEGGLAALLRSAGITWLIVSGVWSEACVAATVTDAIAQGFHVLLIKDACGSGTETMHRTAILNLANRLYGGAITDTAKALRLMQGEQVAVWRTDRPVPMRFDLRDISKLYEAL